MHFHHCRSQGRQFVLKRGGDKISEEKNITAGWEVFLIIGPVRRIKNKLNSLQNIQESHGT